MMFDFYSIKLYNNELRIYSSTIKSSSVLSYLRQIKRQLYEDIKILNETNRY